MNAVIGFDSEDHRVKLNPSFDSLLCRKGCVGVDRDGIRRALCKEVASSAPNQPPVVNRHNCVKGIGDVEANVQVACSRDRVVVVSWRSVESRLNGLVDEGRP
jgi:hypothetical protein